MYKWTVNQDGFTIDDENRPYVAQIHPHNDRKAEYARLISAAPENYNVSWLLAELFPEEDMDEMDASIFVDRAGRIMSIVSKAKQAIAKAAE